MTGPPGDIEWLDDEDAPPPREDEVLTAGSDRSPMRRRTRIALGVLAVALLGGAVTLAATAGRGDDSDRQQAAPTALTVTPGSRSVAPIPSSERTFALELPGTAPKAALAAIRETFPGAELTSFSAALAGGSGRQIVRFYNVTAGRRLVTITLSPPQRGDTDAVFRTARTVEIAQTLGKQHVQIRLTSTRGAPTATDFAAIQRLVQDTRLLATR